MSFLADLHLHSRYSVATSRQATLEGYCQWARVKGLGLLGTGDFTHPGWFAEIREKLRPLGSGLFRLKEEKNLPPPPGIPCREAEVLFCLSAEISLIYKKQGQVRKIHCLVYVPDLETASRLSARLSTIGNLASDGRPILGLDARSLLEILLELSPQAHLIPAHIWTPWFSLFGSKSGFDRLEDCFEDLTPHLFALETGLSSDPEMNWRWSALDRYTLVSNSDAHSPPNLGREANRFDSEPGYEALFAALKTGRGFEGTYEFFPEEGKYHLDGHRKCRLCLEPEETVRLKEVCPVCGEKLTVGVMHRVLKLADRLRGERPAGAAGFRTLIPLPEILAEITGQGAGSKRVGALYGELIGRYGSELSLLFEVPLEEVGRGAGAVFAEALRRMREGSVEPQPGFDGQFGVIRVFKPGELERLRGQELFTFAGAAESRTHARSGERDSRSVQETGLAQAPDLGPARAPELRPARAPDMGPARAPDMSCDSRQEEILALDEQALLVAAGPGSGKTRLLTHWIARQIERRGVKPEEILAVTFTHKAAFEMEERLGLLLGERAAGIQVSTFHGFCYGLLRESGPAACRLSDGEAREQILGLLFPQLGRGQIAGLSRRLERHLEDAGGPLSAEDTSREALYLEVLRRTGGVDLSGLIARVNELLASEPELLARVRRRFTHLAVDELQDINPAQYRLLLLLAGPPAPGAEGRGEVEPGEPRRRILAIGDPNQAIYGFRGSRVELFFRFAGDFHARQLSLERNYRSTATLQRAAHALLEAGGRPGGPGQEAARPEGERITVFAAESPAQEGRFIAAAIDRLVGGTRHLTASAEGGWSFADMAVLYRLHPVGRGLLAPLREAGIPVSLRGHASWLSEPPFALLKPLLALAADPGDPLAARILLEQTVPGLVLAKDLALPGGREPAEGPLAEADALKGLGSRLALGREQRERLEALCGLLEEVREEAAARGAAAGLERIFARLIRLPEGEEELALKREQLLETAARCGSDLGGFLRQAELNLAESEGPWRAEKVSLLSFHAAKGLEFPVVFIAGAEEGVAPLLGEGADPQEERRLFYVALTRARERLFLSRSAWRALHGRREEMPPSRFLEEIPEALRQEARWEHPPEDRFRQLSLFS